MSKALIETWQIHQRVNLYLLDTLSPEQLDVKPEKGKSVRNQFRHVHDVRLMWLKSGAPELLAGLDKLPEDTDAPGIAVGLSASGIAIESMLEMAFETGKRINGFKPHTEAFVGYLIAHESHHRGQIELSLRQAGLPVSDSVGFGLWAWGTR